ncbi:hypothetical protein [Jannaschia pohangensis]|uniref:Uncharacterized protein n=1 Tax=Jannaschia pohangensis TaxID=390807 RepID=A0A1I3R6H0_9RHOB|nr:hypothetical protein [Jannaschia pohangensis]SFJ41650.1 hypothetical protein SAMN04488095_2799 [Jannaschia pohangensis]
MLKWVFRRSHKKAVKVLRRGVDMMLERERAEPDEFATIGMVLPVVLLGLREKSKRPIDVILNPAELTYRQRAELIQCIDEQSRLMAKAMRDNPADDGAYVSRVCLNWLDALHQAHFQAASMPDVVPEMTNEVLRDISDLVFRALDQGEIKKNSLSETPEDGQVLH